MPITPSQIDSWRSEPSETQHLEFKEAKNGFDTEKLYGYCVAIGNEGGGHLLLGVKNEAPRDVVGTAAFHNVIDITKKIFTKIGFRVDVEEVRHPSGRVLVFAIPSRVKGTAYHLEGRYLMRVGDSLQPMGEEQLRRIFAEGAPDWLEEPAQPGLSMDDVISLLDVNSYFDLMHLPSPGTQEGIIERLLAERLVDCDGSKYAIRRLGGLLLAKDLRNFPELSRKALRVVVYSGASKLDTKLDRTNTSGYAVGFRGLIKFIMDQLPSNEVFKDAIRREVKLVPDIVIRELVANAMIHQDFMITGASIAVDIYANRVVISNPGTPIVQPARFIDGYQSRNERLADIMRRMGICEEKGSGIDKVVFNAELYQLPAPSFLVDGTRTHVTLYGPTDLVAMDRADRVRACYQHCALKYVMSERMTNQTLRKRFNLPDSKSAISSQIIAYT